MPTINVVMLDENPHETKYGIREDTSTRGADLDGTIIRATYADGTTETLTWQKFDQWTYGGAEGQYIEMSYGYEFHQLSTTKPLASLEINLQPASSVFDMSLASDEDPDGGSTLSSKGGYPFGLSPAYEGIDGTITATYSGIVNLKGSAAVGDLYTTIVIDFSGLPGGGLLGNLEWESDMDTMKVAGDLLSTGVPCIVRGTLVTTDRGDVPVEDLKSGCKVLTKDNGFQELIFSLSQVIDKNTLEQNEKLYPVRIMAGALGSGLPKRDLLVSRQHRIAVRSRICKRMFGSETALVAAIRLSYLPGIFIDDTVDVVEYFHLIFRKHEVIFAEGAPTESFLINFKNMNKLNRLQREEMAAIFPEVRVEGYLGASEYIIPTGALQKEMIKRHIQNAEALISVLSD